MNEPHVRINGITLDDGQTMALRVAVSECIAALAEPERRASLGLIALSYHARLREVEKLMLMGESTRPIEPEER